MIITKPHPGLFTSIVTSDLVLHLDAGNTASYPGSGTTWTDLSPSGNNGTLGGGAGYTSGSIVFDGVDDYVDCGGAASIKPTSAITVDVWIKVTSVASNSRILSDWHQSGSSGDRWIFYCGSPTTITWYMVSTGQAEGAVATSYTFTAGVWTNLTGTYNGTTQSLYVNGASFSSASRTGTLYSGNSSQTVRLGKQAEAGGGLNGNISNVRIYNRALSASEVQQNYNALRSRFGV